MLSIPFTAFGQKVNTLSNGQLLCQQYAQADTTRASVDDTSIVLNKESACFFNKGGVKTSSVIKTTISSALWGTCGLLVGYGIASIPFSSGAADGGISGSPSLMGILIGGTPGAIVGISAGSYFSGRKYRKGKYMTALAGTILPALTVAGVTALFSDKNKYDMDATLITFALSPVTSTAAYYILSEPKN